MLLPITHNLGSREALQIPQTSQATLHTMLLSRTLQIAVIGAACLPATAFTVTRPAFVVGNHIPSTSTCLRAEGGEEAQEEVAAGGDSVGGAEDILSSPAFLTRKKEVLENDIAKCEEEIAAAQEQAEAGKAEWGPQLEDLANEYKKIQERMTNQNKQGDTMATTQVVREMLEVLDNFDRAFGVIEATTDEEKKIEEEYRAVYQSILDVFDKLGVKEVETVGTEFDYEVHQAVMQRPSDEYDEGIVVEEFQKGFVLEETLIRAAMVSVAV